MLQLKFTDCSTRFLAVSLVVAGSCSPVCLFLELCRFTLSELCRLTCTHLLDSNKYSFNVSTCYLPRLMILLGLQFSQKGSFFLFSCGLILFSWWIAITASSDTSLFPNILISTSSTVTSLAWYSTIFFFLFSFQKVTTFSSINISLINFTCGDSVVFSLLLNHPCIKNTDGLC